MHFGLYLKNKGIITAEQLVVALEAQLTTLPKIGQIALEEGVLAPRDIFEIMQAQRAAPNVRFGELAIEMRLMKRDQLMRLLMIQADRKRPEAEILVEQGALTKQQAATEMTEFRRSLADRRTVKVVVSKIVPAPRGQMVATRISEATAV